ncbi:hypothetical protein RCS94_02370 [Orbaceae bacterium ac157xtp]
MIAPISYGALSATSANTIKGSKPELIGQTVAKKLGFKVGNTSYSEALGNIVSNTAQIFDKDLKLNEFEIQGLTVDDFTVAANYYDVDGDVEHATMPFTLGSISHKWLDSNGSEITNETKMIGCGSGLSLPLTLKVSIPVQVHSIYGDPRDSEPTVLEQNYQIATTAGICFARPNQMAVYPNYAWAGKNIGGTWDFNGSSAIDPILGGGYSSDFVVISNGITPAGIVNVIDGGFRENATRNFPTTGFPKASFDLVMAGNASDYTFSSNGGSAVTVDTSGKVTLNSKPSGAVTITATENATGQAHPYTFTVAPTKWVVPKLNSANGDGNYTYEEAITACGDESKIPSRAQLTNSPLITAPQDWSWMDNFYTRAIGGGVINEWGWSNASTYPGSKWYFSWDYYWTREKHSSGYPKDYHFIVYSSSGVVHYFDTGRKAYVACLE